MHRTPPTDIESSDWDPENQLRRTLHEIQCMCAHATSRGIAMPLPTAEMLAEIIKDVDGLRADDGHGSARELDAAQVAAATAKAIELHARLSALVAPAKPSSLESNRVDRFGDWLRQYPTVALIALAGVAGVALFALFAKHVVARPGSFEVLDLRGQIACAGAAILGAAFYSTFEASKYIVERTYDRQYTGVYVMRFFLGVVAGMLLANFGAAWMKPDSVAGKFGVATLALLGGYSADAVNRILMRLSETLSTFVQGSSAEELKAKEDEVKRIRTVVESQTTHHATSDRDTTDLPAPVGRPAPDASRPSKRQ